MPTTLRSVRGLDLLAAVVGGALLHMGRRRIGDSYADELRETFILRLADFRGLPRAQRLGRVGRELAALLRLAGTRHSSRRPPLPHRPARFADRLGSLWFDLRGVVLSAVCDADMRTARIRRPEPSRLDRRETAIDNGQSWRCRSVAALIGTPHFPGDEAIGEGLCGLVSDRGR